MRLLISEQFFKNLPFGREKKILEKLKRFIDELEFQGINNVSKGFYSRLILGNDKIYKFRIDDSSRILFMYGKDLGIIREEFKENTILVLDYCDHDSQIRRSKAISKKNAKYIDLKNKEEKFNYKSIDEEIDDYYSNYVFNPEEHIIRIQNHLNLNKIENENSIFYLNEKQNEALKKPTPLMLFGSAGSGKTTVSINKMYNLYKDYNMNVIYITYSKYLLEESKKYFNILCNEFGTNEQNLNYEFMSINELLLINSNKKSYIKYREFKKWYDKSLLRNKTYSKLNYSCLEIWREIRGIIKGMVGYSWIAKNEISLNNINEETFKFLYKNNFLKKYNEKIQIIKEINYIKDTLQRDNTIINKDIVNKDLLYIEYVMEKSVCENSMLSFEEYFSLPESFSNISVSDRKEIYEIAKKYELWKKKNNKYDENDLTREVLNNILDKKIKKYDFIIVDEVQDLTEIQIYLLLKMLKKSQNIFFSGDYNQTINPTYFDTHRIITLFMKKYNQKIDLDKILINLSVNYRNSKNIVFLSKRLNQLRKEKLNESKRNYYEENAIKESNKKPFILSANDKNKKKLLELAIKRHYVSIVVCDENDKYEVEKFLGVKNRVFTVSDMKGLENKYIVCYNIISKYKKQWEEIFKSSLNDGNTLIHSYYFNILYVAISRATEYLCLYEEDISYDLKKYIYDYIEEVEEFDEVSLCLNNQSTSLDYYKYALKLEEKEKYDEAVEEYKLSGLDETCLEIKRCIAKKYFDEGNFEKAGDLFFSIEEYELAKKAYKICDNKSKYMGALISQKDTYEDVKKELNQNPIKFIKKFVILDKIDLAKLCELYYFSKFDLILSNESYKKIDLEINQMIYKTVRKING